MSERGAGWRDPSAPGGYTAPDTAPDTAPAGPPGPVRYVPDDGPPDPEGSLERVVAPRTSQPRPPTAALRPPAGQGRASPTRRTRGWAAMTAPLRQRLREERESNGSVIRRIVWIVLVVIVIVLLLVFLPLIFGRGRLPSQLTFTVNSYYWGVEDGVPHSALAGYLCPGQQGSWRAAQTGPDGDTRRGIIAHHIDSGSDMDGKWSVHVTLTVSDDSNKEHDKLTLVEQADGRFLICGGTDRS